MARVAGIDSGSDWTFGKGKASYKTLSEMVRQNVLTRIRSFAGDWFLDTDAHIDWLTILGNRNNEASILSEVRRVTLSTLGVSIIEELRVESVTERKAVIRLRFTDIYQQNFDELIEV